MIWKQALIDAGWAAMESSTNSGTFLVITPEGERLPLTECDEEAEAWLTAWEEQCFREFWYRFNQRIAIAGCR